MRGLVAAGVGAALLPAFSVPQDDESIMVAPLHDTVLSRVVGLFWHRERLLSAAANEFREITYEVCGRLDAGAAAA